MKVSANGFLIRSCSFAAEVELKLVVEVLEEGVEEGLGSNISGTDSGCRNQTGLSTVLVDADGDASEGWLRPLGFWFWCGISCYHWILRSLP